jgi:O-antigen/teichoic acid export membrane protein
MRSRVIFTVAKLIPSLLGVVTIAVLTRLLQPVEYGHYALGLSIIFFLTIGTFEWLGLSVLRMATTAKDPALFFGTVMSCFCSLMGLSAVVAAVVLAVGDLGDYAPLVGASLLVAFVSAWVELKQRLQLAELRQSIFFWTSMGRAVVTAIVVCTTAFLYPSAPTILVALALAVLLVGIVAREPRLTLLRYRFDPEVCRTLLRFGLPMSVSVGLATILASVDKWMLQGLQGPEAVGLFTAATSVAQVPILALASSIGPVTYSMAVHALEFRSPEIARTQLSQNFIVMLGIIVPGAAGLIALSDNLAHILVGQLYWESAVLLAPWLAVTAVLSSLRAFYVDYAFQLASKTSPLIWTTLLAVVLNVVIDVWSIPAWGQLGAAIGSFGAVLVSLIAAWIASRPIFRLPLPLGESAKVLAASAIMFVVLGRVNWLPGLWGLFSEIAAGVGVYTIAIVAFNVLGVREFLGQRWAELMLRGKRENGRGG